MPQPHKGDECRLEIEATSRLSAEIPEVVARLASTCGREGHFDHLGPTPIPSRQAVVDIVRTARNVLFPGYFAETWIEPVNLEYYLGQEVSALFELLTTQVISSIQHDCYRYAQPCSQCREKGRRTAEAFILSLPSLRGVLASDVRAAFEGDPSANSHDDIIFGYPGFLAVSVYRMAHLLYEEEVPLLPRMMTEYAHALTGIDIHPGAEIGDSFFIDHGTGVVIGQTSRIGRRVRIYQGVTLGALSLPRGAGEALRGRQRHPSIEDDVIIYAGATILGGETIIGARSIIGGNVWITESVPPDTKVILKRPELIYIGPEEPLSQRSGALGEAEAASRTKKD